MASTTTVYFDDEGDDWRSTSRLPQPQHSSTYRYDRSFNTSTASAYTRRNPGKVTTVTETGDGNDLGGHGAHNSSRVTTTTTTTTTQPRQRSYADRSGYADLSSTTLGGAYGSGAPQSTSFFGRTNMSRLGEAHAHVAAARALEDQVTLRDSLNESRVAAKQAQEQSAHLSQRLVDAEVELARDRRLRNDTEDRLNSSLHELTERVADLEYTSALDKRRVRDQEQAVRGLTDKLSTTYQDLRRRDAELLSKDDYTRQLEIDLRMRQDTAADLKMQRQQLQAAVEERDEHIRSLRQAIQDLEERLRIESEKAREADLAVSAARGQLEDLEQDAQYRARSMKQTQQTLEQDLEVARDAINARDREISFLRKKVEEMEQSIVSLRREIQLRDERLDKRHAEVQSWTSECDRMRMLLEQSRQRQIDAVSDHEARMKDERVAQQELMSKLSNMEVEKSVAIAAKTELIQDVARLERLNDQKDSQIRSLQRQLEESMLHAAESGSKRTVKRSGAPMSRRTTASASSYATSSKWRY
eukprot:m.363176 g.363176  ORF g.363176 m.363176 type:complete len:529 (-) comp21589_c0_seq1:252-1838(-)